MAAGLPRILLLGAGRMGGALLQAWLAQRCVQGPPVVLEPTPTASLKALANGGDVRLNPPPGANTPDIAIIAIKPQSFEIGLAALKPYLGAKTAILSVAAGKTVASLAEALGTERAIIRTMPNSAAAVAKSMTVAFANAHVTAALRDQCTALLRAAGDVAWIGDEAQMDAVTALSGSGPAYAFYLVECLAAAGVAQGLDPQLAMRLARSAVTGAGALLTNRSEAPAILRAEVTSPGGTTEAALRILMDDGVLASRFQDAVRAATERGQSLNRGS